MGGDAQGPRFPDRPAAPDLRRARPAQIGQRPAGLTAARTTSEAPLSWIDGRVVERSDRQPHPQPIDHGCYTTARVESGRVVWAVRHVRRLRRDARRLGLGDLEARTCARALAELARAAFPAADGVVRLEAGRDAAGRFHLIARARPLGSQPGRWEAITAPAPHPGPGATPGVKRTSRQLLDAADAAACAAGADEALLFDGVGRLVEGARTNLIAVRADGHPVTPPLARGGVDGIAREIALDALPAVAEEDVDREALASARELVALNAVQRAQPIVRIDGRPVGDGRPGAWFRRIARALERTGDA